ncbi:hypothetical protein C8R45DRAFT_930249 [Mycena sanguinolenta]|nr:hypothetical protein C8R45DRAFT_930249 [Mycena sanguinolenta]
MTELPNPFTPLAFLPPALASQFEVSRYFTAATLGAYVWDIGLNLGNDYALLFKHNVRFPTIGIHIIFIITTFVFQVAPVGNCNALALGFGICVVLMQSITAVWHSNRIVYAVFSILWLAVLGAAIVDPVVIRGRHLGPSSYCIDTVIPPSTETTVIMPLINDTAIFLAITYRILAHTIVADSPMARLRAFFGGSGLSALSRALLESGQHFYLIAVATHLTLLVILKMSQLSPVYHAMLAFPGFALVNAMACLVFRRIKFGIMSSDGTFKLPTMRVSSDLDATPLPLHYRRADPTTTEFSSDTTSPLSVRVETERFEGGTDANQERSKPITSLV